jgi:tetratricopeptide (TPR) repeat protein
MLIRPPFIFVLLLGLADVTRADSIIVQGMSPQKVTVTGFVNGKLQYQTAGGATAEREFARVQQLVVDNEPVLNAAEAALASGKPDASLDQYANAIRSSTTPWVRLFAARRLLDAAGPQGRFEPRLTAYLALLSLAPADAAGRQPSLPNPGNRLLEVAVAETEAALKAPKLPDANRVTLLNFLTELHRRRGDQESVVATVERMAKASPTAASDPAVQAQLVGLKITQAKAAIDKGDYVTAVRIIDDSRGAIIDPLQQADALFVLAQAKQANADPTDKAALHDAALAFMRVVAHANTLPGRPNVLASLRATAAILERTGRTDEAIKIYAQIVRDYSALPVAVTVAQADLARLKK